MQEVVNGFIFNGSVMKLLSQEYFHIGKIAYLNGSFSIFVVVSQVNLKTPNICAKKYKETIKFLKKKEKTVKTLLTWRSPARNHIDTNYITDSK